MNAHTSATQGEMTPQSALEALEAGNARFVGRSPAQRDLIQQVEQTAGGQFPFAVVLSCIDSRASAELLFDQGIGDMFSARIAGNFVNDDILGSMEFACKVAGAKLIVVLGHTACGAVRGAIDEVELGNLTGMLANITPAISETEFSGERAGTNPAFTTAVAHQNVRRTIDQVRERSEVLRSLLDDGSIGIVGGMYDVKTGKVTFDSLEKT